jgi:Flp pilus assembly protein protease CpaA
MKFGFALFILFAMLAFLNHKDVLSDKATWIAAVIIFVAGVVFFYAGKRFLK